MAERKYDATKLINCMDLDLMTKEKSGPPWLDQLGTIALDDSFQIERFQIFTFSVFVYT